jgi:hypothetical protein
MRDQAEAQFRWSELYAVPPAPSPHTLPSPLPLQGRPSFGSTRDLAASQALRETMAAQPGIDAARTQAEFAMNPMGMSIGSPAQRIRSSMHFE